MFLWGLWAGHYPLWSWRDSISNQGRLLKDISIIISTAFGIFIYFQSHRLYFRIGKSILGKAIDKKPQVINKDHKPQKDGQNEWWQKAVAVNCLRIKWNNWKGPESIETGRQITGEMSGTEVKSSLLVMMRAREQLLCPPPAPCKSATSNVNNQYQNDFKLDLECREWRKVC